MGKIDEHWCSDCKRTLDKSKDEYVELEGIHLGTPSKRGMICKDCLQKEEYAGLRKLLEASNPDFKPFIECNSYQECALYKPIKNKPVRCAHIATIDDTIYCKRKHPGKVKLPVERAERKRLEQQVIQKFIRTYARGLPQPARQLVEDELSNGWIPPSGVVEKRHQIEEVNNAKMQNMQTGVPEAGRSG